METLMAAEPVSSTAVLIATATPLISKLASALAEPTKGAAGRVKERLEVKFRKGFSRYIEENTIRFSTVKTIISSTTGLHPVRLTPA
jgi:hypothetical protein